VNGVGVCQDGMEAAMYLKSAADCDHPVRAFNHGLCWCKGEGTAADFYDAAKYFRLSANHDRDICADSHCPNTEPDSSGTSVSLQMEDKTVHWATICLRQPHERNLVTDTESS
jgi:hypothetical protein